MTKLTDTAILLAGKSHPHVNERVKREFRAIELGAGGLASLDEATRRTIRGAAVMTRVDAVFVDALPALEIVASFGVGYDLVDANYCASRNVVVTNTPDVLSEEVADTALGLLINTVRELPRAEAWLREGRWKKDGAYPLTPATLRGRHAGIFGLGRIGLAIARRLEALGLKVSYHSRRPVDDVHYQYQPSLKSLAESVDTLISVVPGGAATEKVVNAEVLKALGPDGIFINIGRGSTVDEPALIDALARGSIRAAGLDVFADEPNVPDALLALPNVCLLPHVGSSTRHTRQAMADLVVDNLGSWFERGQAITPVPETAGLERK